MLSDYHPDFKNESIFTILSANACLGTYDIIEKSGSSKFKNFNYILNAQ